MHKVTCKCGQTKMNFKQKIPFFIGECCEKAGYDYKGDKMEEKSGVINVIPEEVPITIMEAPTVNEIKIETVVKAKHPGGRPKGSSKKQQEEPKK